MENMLEERIQQLEAENQQLKASLAHQETVLSKTKALLKSAALRLCADLVRCEEQKESNFPLVRKALIELEAVDPYSSSAGRVRSKSRSRFDENMSEDVDYLYGSPSSREGIRSVLEGDDEN